MSARSPYVAGQFYPSGRKRLEDHINSLFTHKLGPGNIPTVNEEGPRNIISLISPHAGYIYSGAVAAHGFYELASDGRPDLFILIGPNHSGLGPNISVSTETWRTPFGDVEIDLEIAKEIAKSDEIMIESTAHEFEHSIEVQLPFLQYLYGEVRFVPICMRSQDLETSITLAEAVSQAIVGRNVVTIASTDLTHFESHNIASEKDNLVIDAIRQLDEKQLQDVVKRENISMCGYGPVTATIIISKKMGGKNVKILKYATSGDITGEKARVVGYLSSVISK